MFVHDNPLPGTHVEDALRWNLDVAARTGVALDRHDSHAVLGTTANPQIGLQQAVVDLFGHLPTHVVEDFLFSTGLGNDLIELGPLGLEVLGAHVEFGLYLGDDLALLLELGFRLTDALLGELDFEGLVFNLLVQGLELAVVPHTVLLLLETLDHGTGVNDRLLALLDAIGDAIRLGLEALEARFQTGDLVLKVFDLEREFTADDTKAVNSAVDELKVVQGAELLFCARGFGLLGHQDT